MYVFAGGRPGTPLTTENLAPLRRWVGRADERGFLGHDDLVLFRDDIYRAGANYRHTTALGVPALECWVGTIFRVVFDHAGAAEFAGTMLAWLPASASREASR